MIGPYHRSLAPALLLVPLMLLAPRAALEGQNGDAAPAAVTAVPFGPGERMEYQVKLGVFGEVGEGSVEVVGMEAVRGHDAYRLRFDLEGGVLFAKVDDTMESWLDAVDLYSHRFVQDQKEVSFERHRVLDFYPAERKWVRDGGEDEGELASDAPLDDLSFLYFARTLPLQVGETYSFHRYFKPESNPVVLRVLRRETVSVPAGEFETIVVQPIIKSKGLFGEGGEAEVYFSDDDRRLLVQIKSKVPVLGSLSFYLDSYSPGERYQPVSADVDDAEVPDVSRLPGRTNR